MSAVRPSKLAEMKAEVEGQGFEFESTEFGWNALIDGDCLLDRSTPTLEDCITAAYAKIFDEKGRVRRVIIDTSTVKVTVKA